MGGNERVEETRDFKYHVRTPHFPFPTLCRQPLSLFLLFFGPVLFFFPFLFFFFTRRYHYFRQVLDRLKDQMTRICPNMLTHGARSRVAGDTQRLTTTISEDSFITERELVSKAKPNKKEKKKKRGRKEGRMME